MGILCKLCLFLKKNYSGDQFFDDRALLDLRIYRPDSWRSELRPKFRIGKVLAQNQAASDLGIKQASKTVIKIGLVTLTLNSAPKLAVGQRITW